MKQFLIMRISAILLLGVMLNIQGTAFAASPKGSPPGKHASTVVPNCPVAIRSLSIPQCVPSGPCIKASCYKIDPYASGCATANTYNHISTRSAPININEGNRIVTAGYITNYYSSWCIANWAQVDTGGHIWITTTDVNGHGEKMCYPDNCKDDYFGSIFPTWTNMVDGTNVTTSCASDPVDGDVCIAQ